MWPFKKKSRKEWSSSYNSTICPVCQRYNGRYEFHKQCGYADNPHIHTNCAECGASYIVKPKSLDGVV